MLKKLFWYLLVICSLATVTAYGYVLNVPKDSSERDLQIGKSQISYEQSQSKERILGDIDFVNQWLWIALGFICFGFVVYNGFKLVSARGDQEVFKKSIKGLIGAGIGIVICFISYGVVRVIINLFT